MSLITAITSNPSPLIAAMVTAFTAVFTSYIIVQNNKKLNRKKNAMDAARQFLEDPLNAETQQAVSKLFRSEDGVEIIKKLADSDTGAVYLDLRVQVNTLLTTCETICIGVKMDVYDENVIRETIGGYFSAYYNLLSPFIDKTREERENSSSFRVFEEYAKKWDTDHKEEKFFLKVLNRLTYKGKRIKERENTPQ